MSMLYPFDKLDQEVSWFRWQNVMRIFESFIKMFMFKWLYMVECLKAQKPNERHQGQLGGRGLGTVIWVTQMLIWSLWGIQQEALEEWVFFFNKNSAPAPHTFW